MSETAIHAEAGAEAATSAEPATSRVLFGGFLMGVANLVPGVSGGTMILALGLYDRFIATIAEVTSLRWSRPSLRFFVCILAGAAVAILGLAGPAVWLVTEHRWIAYSLFLGMTLGGVPDLARAVRPFGAREVVAAVAGLLVMAAFAFGLLGGTLSQGFLVLTVIGAVASSSMILPGISGSYVLLIFGLYDVVIGSLRPAALLDDPSASLGILVPVGIGVVIGIGGLSNVLKVLLTRFERPTHAALLGLLLGSVLGLWPFQESVDPELSAKPRRKAIGMLVAGEERGVIAEETGVELGDEEAARLAERYAGMSDGDLKLAAMELERYRPGGGRVALSVVLLCGGFLVTRRLGARSSDDPAGGKG